MKMKSLLLSLSLLVAGCPEAKYQDASGAEPYAGLVGGRYRTNVDMIIHGVSYKRDSNKTIDEFIVTNRPGFDGPEVVTKASVKAGTILRVERVLVCTNCLTSKVKIEIEIEHGATNMAIPIGLTGVGSKDVLMNERGRTSLNSDFFTPL